MRCKQCEYLLWGLQSRRCPECGASFKPSDFEFKPNAVEFHCPHCDQSYFGTGEDGLLFPRSFACVSCGEVVDVDEMVLRPAEGVHEDQASALQESPWTKRRGMSFFRPWAKTTLGAMIHPRRLIRSTPEKSSMFSALWYALITQFLYGLLGLGVLALLGLIVGVTMASGSGSGSIALSLLFGLFMSVVSLLAAGAAIIVAWIIFTHVILYFTGPMEHGFRRTWQAICYSSGANVLSGVPLFGIYLSPVSWIWWSISAAQMLREGQKVSWWRAALAAAVPPTLGVAAVVWAFVALMAPMYRSTGVFQIRYLEAQSVATTVASALGSGQPPKHASAFVVDGTLMESLLVFSDSDTKTKNIAVGDVTLDQLGRAPISEADAAVAAAAASLPDGAVAHRLGDYVFTYNGVDPTDPTQAQLWIVIGWPDPDANPAPSANEIVPIGFADGTVLPLTASNFQMMLDLQNKLRASHNLGPIPHPRTLHNTKPVGVLQPTGRPSAPTSIPR